MISSLDNSIIFESSVSLSESIVSNDDDLQFGDEVVDDGPAGFISVW